MKVNACGIEMNCELSGQGPCLILIHGFSDNLNMWHRQVPVLEKKRTVLRYDVRGHGQTKTPEVSFSMDLFADDLFGLTKALDIERACILGYSMGGRIALKFALRYPDRTTGLILANSAVMGPDLRLTAEQMIEMEERRKQLVALMKTGDIERIAEAMAEHSLSPGTRDRAPHVFQNYKRIKLQNDPKHYPRSIEALLGDMAGSPDLRRLRCPCLVVAGERDGFMSAEVVRSMVSAIPDVALKILPTGHAAAIESPEAFNQAVLEFMDRL